MNGLLQSRKFWIAVVDCVISIVSLLLTRFVSPADTELAMKIIASLQPVILILIASIAAEDSALKMSKE